MERPGGQGGRRVVPIRGEVRVGAGGDGQVLRREGPAGGGARPRAGSAVACRPRQRPVRRPRGGVEGTGRTGSTGHPVPRSDSEKHEIGRSPRSRGEDSRTTGG